MLPTASPKPTQTLVLGASPNPSRYSYTAVLRLLELGHPVIPVGIKEGHIGGQKILVGRPKLSDVETVTMYVGPSHQSDYYDYLFDLNPARIIFNPGTENSELAQMAESRGIHTLNACTLVLLATGQY